MLPSRSTKQAEHHFEILEEFYKWLLLAQMTMSSSRTPWNGSSRYVDAQLIVNIYLHYQLSIFYKMINHSARSCFHCIYEIMFLLHV